MNREQAVADLTNVMSKFLNLGMPMAQVVAKSTWRPAQVIKQSALGHLSVGAVADVAVLRIEPAGAAGSLAPSGINPFRSAVPAAVVTPHRAGQLGRVTITSLNAR